jgi:glycosyltransferase involved in cell wall biosynthesis
MEKGVIVLLDALKILKERGHAVVCDFVGDETAEISRAQFEQEVHERGLENMAVYQGKQYGDEKERFWNRADVFVFPTFYRNECFPLVVLEAMQHGVPVVTTAEGGIPDMVRDGENGFLCERQNPKDLAEKLERMVSDLSLREKMGQDGYLKYRKYYTLEFFEKRLVDILKAEM